MNGIEVNNATAREIVPSGQSAAPLPRQTKQQARRAEALRKRWREIKAMEEAVDLENAKLAKKIGSERIRLQSVLESLRDVEALKTGYPAVPLPSRVASREGSGIPKRPGIYFVWSDKIVVYVGMSECLKNRVCLSHEKIREGDSVSWIEWPDVAGILFAESYYIGICRPCRNFTESP